MPYNLLRSRAITRASCLRAFAGRDSVQSVVLDATTLSADSNGRYTIPIGSFLTKSVANDPTKVCVYTASGTNADAVQTVTITGTPTGGTFTLTFNGVTSAPIAYNASAAAVQAALVAMSNIYSTANVSCGGGAFPGTAVTVTFQGIYANQPIPTMTATGSFTGGSAPGISVATTTPGTTAQAIIGVYDGPDRDFFGNTTNCDEVIPMYFHACDFDISQLQNWNLYGATAITALANCNFR